MTLYVPQTDNVVITGVNYTTNFSYVFHKVPVSPFIYNVLNSATAQINQMNDSDPGTTYTCIWAK